MLDKLKQEVYEANKLLPQMKLVELTWGNVSGIDRKSGMVVIKPSGVEYKSMKSNDMVVVDLNGKIIEGNLKPSSDLATHLVIYKAFPMTGGVVHTHSQWATIWAQSGLKLPALGTTHADYFYGEIPCSRNMTQAEIEKEYEKETGNVIIETFKNYDYNNTPGVLVKGHGPFTWGKTPKKAVENSFVLEEIAKMAYYTLQLNPETSNMDPYLLKKHFFRKHGSSSYYGQTNSEQK